jgi:hypothetical protein
MKPYNKIISEIRKSEKVYGKQSIDKFKDIGHEAAIKYIKNNINDENISKYGITMTDIPKVGINPKSEYNTPIGIYFYPLQYYMNVLEANNRLPFQHNAKYINILKFKSSKILNISNLSQSEFVENSEKLVDLKDSLKESFRDKYTEHINELFLKASSNSRVSGFGGELWYILYKLSSFLSFYSTSLFQTSSDSNVIWNWLLRKMGYDIILDLGKKIIHENEPTQGFALSKSSIEWVKTIENVDERSLRDRKDRKDFFDKVASGNYETFEIIDDLIINNRENVIYDKIEFFSNLVNKEDIEFREYFVDRFPLASLLIKLPPENVTNLIKNKIKSNKYIPTIIQADMRNIEFYILLRMYENYKGNRNYYNDELFRKFIVNNIDRITNTFFIHLIELGFKIDSYYILDLFSLLNMKLTTKLKKKINSILPQLPQLIKNVVEQGNFDILKLLQYIVLDKETIENILTSFTNLPLLRKEVFRVMNYDSKIPTTLKKELIASDKLKEDEKNYYRFTVDED